MAGRVYECSGLCVRSEIPLPAQLADSDPDVRLTMAEAITVQEVLSDQVVAALEIDDQPRYTIFERTDGYLCRFPTVADVHVSRDLKEVRCHPVVGGPSDFIPVLIAGTVVAFLLSLTGHCVLHASAVEVEEGALAFAGASGQGKSTMAALFTSDGAALIADDVLSLDIDIAGTTPVIRCARSSPEIRLRAKAASLIARFDSDTPIRTTVDERQAIAPRGVSTDRVAMAGIILPRPDRERHEVTTRRLQAAEAALWLTRCQRIEGWTGREHLRRQFESIGHVVAAMPVFEVGVPWGPPFSAELTGDILRSCGFSGEMSHE